MGGSLMWLNVGCGPFRAPEPWWNIDRVYRPGNTEPDETVANGLPYENGSVERMYCGHVMEHQPIRELVEVAKDWLRVLAPNAEICVVGPDVNRSLELFRSGQMSRDQLWERMEHDLLDFYNPGMHQVGDFYAHHHWNCIPDRAMVLLKEAGFIDIREVDINSDELNGWPLVSRSNDQFAVLARRP